MGMCKGWNVEAGPDKRFPQAEQPKREFEYRTVGGESSEPITTATSRKASSGGLESSRRKDSGLRAKLIKRNSLDVFDIDESTAGTDQKDQYKSIKQYDVQRVLGIGAFGKVFLGKSRTDSKEYALKVFNMTMLKLRLVPNDTSMTQFDLVFQEAKRLTRVKSPCIVPLKELVMTQEHIVLVMEYAPLGSLGEADESMKYETIRSIVVKRVLRQLIEALRYLHSRGIAHRDVKPENILMYSAAGRCKLTDLGSALEFKGDSDWTADISGTPSFMPPEMVRASETGYQDGTSDGGAHFSARRADIWSLGVTLYAVLFGELPFQGRKVVDLYASISGDKLTFPSYYEGGARLNAHAPPSDPARAVDSTRRPDPRFRFEGGSSDYIQAVSLLKGVLDKNASSRTQLRDLSTHSWIRDVAVHVKVKSKR